MPLPDSHIKSLEPYVRFHIAALKRLRALYQYPLVGRVVGQPGQGASQVALSTGEFAVPVQGKSEAAEVSIESWSHLPVTLPYAEWVVDLTPKAHR